MRDRYILFCLVVVLFAMLTGAIFKHQILQQTDYISPDQTDDSEQIEYLQATPNSENYQPLPEDCPIIYREMPQYYFYAAPPYYVPGVSISLGGGFWYTPGCNFVFNYTYYSPTVRPIPHCHGFYREPIHLHFQHADVIIKKPHHEPEPNHREPNHREPKIEQPHEPRIEQPKRQPRIEQPHEPRIEQPKRQPRIEQPHEPRHEQKPHFTPPIQPHHSEPPKFHPPHKK